MEKYKEQTEEKNVALFFRYIISLFGSNINIIYHIFFSEKRARNNWYFFGNNPSIAVIFSYLAGIYLYTSSNSIVSPNHIFHVTVCPNCAKIYFYSYSKISLNRTSHKNPPGRRYGSPAGGTVLRLMRRLDILCFLISQIHHRAPYHLAYSLASSAVISR